ncbi:Rieske 2Fe-2S domain-containing protein [Sulfurimonas sp.]|uniref:Rieske 2Fe-2S domain-containing protein n=1 Tax=Sulfurimonas sp. TaxID=2022749 RepID=UPI002633B725|nr:Rieske 2Fe-2S domain-containing protein [Sulfurimonas sp.]MCW8895467.1 Rieske 2Fe-2S domain-containing protein [Sulfurimonas sp.]
MNIEKLKKEWFPLFNSKELKGKPLAKTLLGFKLVFVRIDNEVTCFEDRCPHRNVPLSKGSIVNSQLRCNYHGWSFDKTGELKNIPGCKNCNSIKIQAISTKEIDRIVWVRLEGDKEFYNNFLFSEIYSSTTNFKHLKADFVHSIENFLDPTHTPFIHRGLLRSENGQSMSVTQESDEHGFKTYYKLNNMQNGLINKLFDSGIDENIASCNFPGFAKIDYLKNNKLLFRVSVFFVPINKGEVQMVVNVSLLKTFVPSFLKFILLRPFLELAFYQDKKILESQYKENIFFKKSYEIVDSDLVINHLLHMFYDKPTGKNKVMDIEL